MLATFCSHSQLKVTLVSALFIPFFIIFFTLPNSLNYPTIHFICSLHLHETVLSSLSSSFSSSSFVNTAPRAQPIDYHWALCKFACLLKHILHFFACMCLHLHSHPCRHKANGERKLCVFVCFRNPNTKVLFFSFFQSTKQNRGP